VSVVWEAHSGFLKKLFISARKCHARHRLLRLLHGETRAQFIDKGWEGSHLELDKMGLRQQPRSFSPHPRDVETTNADTLQSAFNLRSPLKPISPSLHRANSTFQYLTAKASSALSHDIMENGSSSEGKDPSAFLSEIIGAPVIVKLNSGVVYKGNTPFPLLMNALILTPF
jgi:hypothetical protein